MRLSREPVAIRFEDLKPGESIVSPAERTVCETVFQPGRMLQIEGQSSHLDETGNPLIRIVMGRASDRVRGSDVVIDSSHLPGWQRTLLPVCCQIKLLREKIFSGAMSPLEERHGRLR